MLTPYGRAIVVAVYVAIFAGLVGLHYYDRHNAVTTAVTKINDDYKDKLIKKENEAVATQNELVSLHRLEIEQKDNEIKSINSKLHIAIGKLRTRDLRPKDYSPDPGAKATCTGAELYRQDGEFLAREAARADTIMQERNYYYNEYENVRTQLKELAAKP